MKKKTFSFSKIIFSVFIFVLFSSSTIFSQNNSSDFSSESKVIRVGFFAFDGYHHIDSTGRKSGYGYEFIQKMLRYNNFTAEYVGYSDSWADMQNMLETGSIDVLTSAQKTPARLEKFDFSTPIGTSAAILTVKAGNNTFKAGEYKTYNGIRVGVINNNSRNDRFEEFAKEHNFSYTLVYYSDTDNLISDLQAEKNIDAIVTSNLRSINNEWILDTFASAPFYAMVKKGNDSLLSTINYAIEKMNNDMVGWQGELFKKYYSGDNGSTIALSSTERKYLASLIVSNRKIKVLVHPDKVPYSYIENGEAKGIIPDVFKEVASRLNLPYTFILPKNRKEYVSLKEAKAAEIVLESRNDLSLAEDMGYKLTDPYIELSYGLIKRSISNGEISTIATLSQNLTSDVNLSSLFKPNQKIIYFDSLDECVDAVMKGKADGCYMYDYSAQKYVNESVRGNLQATTIPDIRNSLTFAVAANNDYRLLILLNKGVTSVKLNYVDTAIISNTNFSLSNLSLTQLLWRNPAILVFIIGLLAIVVFLLLLRKQAKENEHAIQEKNKELERFIGYVCKANASVLNVNFNTNKALSYNIVNGHVEKKEQDFIFEKNVSNNIYPEDFERFTKDVNENNLKNIIDNGIDRYFEYRVKTGDSYKWFAITVIPITRDKKQPNNVLIFKRDIDETKKIEEERRDALKSAMDAANLASESKGNFLSNMSHEIRTPLNAIIGYLSIANDSSSDIEKIMHCISNSEIAAKHLLQIINDVLDMSSIESGKLKIANEKFDLKREISNITAIFYQNAKAKNINFETRVDSLTQEIVVGDQLRFNQVIMNLLSNALKFTPENGNVSFNIKQMREDRKKIFLQFTVADTGIGMSADYMKRIFHPFEQENAGTAKRFGGSGLGLSITNNLIKMMGGSISVESVQNKGTTFTVLLSFGRSEDKSYREIPVNFSHMRALVVDDDEDTCSYMESLLKRLSITCDTTSSGKKAIRRVLARKEAGISYDLCIIDWCMNEMSGLETASELRKICDSDMPIIIATAYDYTSIMDEAKSIGVDKIISKPLFQSTLFDLLVDTYGKYQPLPAKKESAKIDFSGIKMILAEDNEMNMEIALDILKKSGLEITPVKNGQEALDAFLNSKSGSFDVILMDIQMPVMDGYTATKKIRESDHPDAKTIPIIAMTANAFSEDVTAALAAGMNDHVSKPISYDRLFGALLHLIKK